MIKLKSSKVNEVRLWGLALIMGGMMLMIIGLAGIVFQWGTIGKIIAAVFMIIGAICLMGSMVVYFWAGTMSTNAVHIECPQCGKTTKIIGRSDRCMFCKTLLSLDPPQASNG